MLNPVRSDATPAASRNRTVSCQTSPWLSGVGHTGLFETDGTIDETPTGVVNETRMLAPPPLKAASPKYSAYTVNVPVPPNRYAGTVISAAAWLPRGDNCTVPSAVVPTLKSTTPVGMPLPFAA